MSRSKRGVRKSTSASGSFCRGRGPDDQPYLYENGRTFLLGRQLTGAAANPGARDLPRSGVADPLMRRAIIGDPRNDENVIISQLQGLFHRFHNKVANAHPEWPFPVVQREVRFHYQWVVLNDFLPTLIDHHVLTNVLPHLGHHDSNIVAHRPNLGFFHWKNHPFMPLEFSAAAYRFGHSMVRPGYRLSETIGPLLIFAADPDQALTAQIGIGRWDPAFFGIRAILGRIGGGGHLIREDSQRGE